MSRSLRALFVTCVSLAMVVLPGAIAGMPQPMCVYFGQALDGFGTPYAKGATVALLRNGAEIASHTINGSLSPGVNFALFVHIDDGSGARTYSPRALRPGDVVSVVVRDVEGEKTIMERQSVPPIGEPGTFRLINVTAATDADGDGLPDAWENELILWSGGALTNIADVNPADDFDGDGQSNWSEYHAGTFPFLSRDLLFAEEFGATSGGRMRVSFFSVPGKLYGARYVTDMSHSVWSPSPLATSETAEFQTTPIEGTGDWLSLYLPAPPGNAFVRPTVETFESYKLGSTKTVTSLSAWDDASDSPYPVTRFQIGDNGGTNFAPWTRLAGTPASGSLGVGAPVGPSGQSWKLSGFTAVGRSLFGRAHRGVWSIRMVHDSRNSGFSGFNLKAAAVPGFEASEVIRVGMLPRDDAPQGRGVSVSLDGGLSYAFLDCGWTDGRGDTLAYQLEWDESGEFILTIENLDEAATVRFGGRLPTSAITTFGVALLGTPSSTEELLFDQLRFDSTLPAASSLPLARRAP